MFKSADSANIRSVEVPIQQIFWFGVFLFVFFPAVKHVARTESVVDIEDLVLMGSTQKWVWSQWGDSHFFLSLSFSGCVPTIWPGS